MKIYIATLLARSLADDKVWQFIELASADKQKVEDFLKNNKKTDILTVNNDECFVERGAIEVELQ